jgi:hypothetical protein
MNANSLQKIFFILLFCILNLQSKAQVFWSENFTTSGAGWTLNTVQGTEGSDPNYFAINDAEGGGITPNLGAPASCGVASNGNNSMYITSVAQFASGAAYDAGGLCGLFSCPLTNRQAESPTINCSGKSNISLVFNYIENGQGVIDNATLWYYNGTTWAQIDDMPKTLTGCGGQGLWVSRTITLPASANNNANVKIAFRWVNNDDGIGSDPSFAVDDITISTMVLTPSITTITNIPSVGKCACDSTNVYFTSVGTYTAGNVYTAQLSDALGSFLSPIAIGSIISASNTGFIPSIIPCATAAGIAYRIRVVSNTPSIIGANNGANIIINTSVNPSIAITQTPANPICANTPITFSASIANGGASPIYQWKKNGLNVGTNTPLYLATGIANSDVITCIVTSNAPCLINTTAASNAITVVVSASPTITIVSTPTNSSVCSGDSAKLCASGAATYLWSNALINCLPFLLTTSTTYTVTGTNAAGCTATATKIVNVNAKPILAITALPSAVLCSDESVTLTAIGASTYTWTGGITNAVAFTPAASTIYIVTGTSASGCTSTKTVAITILPNITPSVIINSTPASPTVGVATTFTASIAPATIVNYQLRWFKGSVLMATNNSPINTFTATMANTQDSVYARLIPYGYCTNPDSIDSKKVGPQRLESLQALSSIGV